MTTHSIVLVLAENPFEEVPLHKVGITREETKRMDQVHIL